MEGRTGWSSSAQRCLWRTGPGCVHGGLCCSKGEGQAVELSGGWGWGSWALMTPCWWPPWPWALRATPAGWVWDLVLANRGTIVVRRNTLGGGCPPWLTCAPSGMSPALSRCCCAAVSQDLTWVCGLVNLSSLLWTFGWVCLVFCPCTCCVEAWCWVFQTCFPSFSDLVGVDMVLRTKVSPVP